MKKIYSLLVLASLCASYSFAQLSSKITVFSEEGKPFYLIVNGIKQNDKPLTNVMVDGLTFPNYKVKVLFEDANLAPIDKNIFTQDADGIHSETAYRIKMNNKGQRVMQLYSTVPVTQQIVYTQSNVPPDMGVVTFRTSETVSNNVVYGTSVSTTTTTTTMGAPGIGMNVNVVDPVTGENVNMNVNANVGMVGGTVTTTTTTTSSSSNQGYYTNTPPPPANTNTGCMYAMGYSDFDAAKRSISGQSFEDSKLKIAKNIASSNCLSAQQVKDICQTFSFEESKLDFAKFAYVRCTERSKFFIVNDVFSFSSSVDELNEYIASVR